MAKIEMTFNPKTAQVEIKAVNAPEDRDLIHQAFRNAIKRSKFLVRKINDIGEDIDEDPIRKEKEQLIETQEESIIE